MSKSKKFKVVGSNDLMEVSVKKRSSYDTESGAVVSNRRMPDGRAQLAFAMIQNWGVVAAMPDGEDAIGRAKWALLPVNDLVSRAFASADAAYAEAASRGWLVDIPGPGECDEIAQDLENGN